MRELLIILLIIATGLLGWDSYQKREVNTTLQQQTATLQQQVAEITQQRDAARTLLAKYPGGEAQLEASWFQQRMMERPPLEPPPATFKKPDVYTGTGTQTTRRR